MGSLLDKRHCTFKMVDNVNELQGGEAGAPNGTVLQNIYYADIHCQLSGKICRTDHEFI